MTASSEVLTTENETWVSGEADVVTKPILIASGNNLAARTVLGQLMSSGEYAPYNPVATNGLQYAVAINAVAVDASSAATNCPAYLGGVFNPDLAVWDAAVTDIHKSVAFSGTNIVLLKPSSGA